MYVALDYSEALVLQCAGYFPEQANSSADFNGWTVQCTSVREVDNDVQERRLVVIPPRADTGVVSDLSVVSSI